MQVINVQFWPQGRVLHIISARFQVQDFMQITFSCILITLHYDKLLDLSNSLNKMKYLKTYLRNEIDRVSLRLHPSMDTAADDVTRNGLLISFSSCISENTKKIKNLYVAIMITTITSTSSPLTMIKGAPSGS